MILPEPGQAHPLFELELAVILESRHRLPGETYPPALAGLGARTDDPAAPVLSAGERTPYEQGRSGGFEVYVFPPQGQQLAFTQTAMDCQHVQILGVWMSMLKPVDELDAEAHEKSSSKTDLALKLSPALKQATFALAAVVLLRLLLSAAPGMGETLLDLIRLFWPRWEYPELLSPILRGLFGACVTFVYIFETVILVVTLLPMLSVESKRRELEFDEEEANDPASQYAKSRR